jgi:hypothetical protein
MFEFLTRKLRLSRRSPHRRQDESGVAITAEPSSESDRIALLVQRRVRDPEVRVSVWSYEDEMIMLGIANALRDDNSFCGPFRKQIYFNFDQHNESRYPVSRHVAQAFQDSLRVNTSLRRIRFEVASSEILSILLIGVAGNTSIEELHLKYWIPKYLCAQDLSNLVATFRHNSNIDTLILEFTPLLRESVPVLANALADGSLHSLKELSLYCVIDAEGAIAVANALGYNKTLKKLSVSGCNITNVVSFAFTDMLKRNNMLEYLHLSIMSRHVRGEGEHALVRATAYNTSLVRLRMQVRMWSSERSLEEEEGYYYQERPEPQSLEINRFRKEYLSHDRTVISPCLYPLVFARVSNKPSMLFLFLQENPSMFIPYLVPDPSTSTGISYVHNYSV